jgi:hypothetical protein
MAMHAPVIHLGVHPHLYRNALAVIAVAALAVVLLFDALTFKPVTAPSVTTADPLLGAPAIEFRAGERAVIAVGPIWTVGDPLTAPLVASFRAGERALYSTALPDMGSGLR